jgi:hypothetical protein
VVTSVGYKMSREISTIKKIKLALAVVAALFLLSEIEPTSLSYSH